MSWLKAIAGQLTVELIIPAVILAFLLLVFAYILVKAQQRPDFDAANFLRDEQGKESFTRLASFIALAVTSWATATMIFKGTMEPSYFLYYCAIWASTPAALKLAERWTGDLPFTNRSIQSQAPPPKEP